MTESCQYCGQTLRPKEIATRDGQRRTLWVTEIGYGKCAANPSGSRHLPVFAVDPAGPALPDLSDVRAVERWLDD